MDRSNASMGSFDSCAFVTLPCPGVLFVEDLSSLVITVATISVAVTIVLALVRRKATTQYDDNDLSLEKRLRKQEFLRRAGDDYGYASSRKGYIDGWRGAEFPELIEPMELMNRKSTVNRMVYLDYAGAALPAKSQLRAILDDASILANPHSSGPVASKTMLLIEQATKRVLDHFNGEPGQFSSLDKAPENCDPKELHPGYEVVFTSGATDALRIVAECFAWTTCHICGSKSKLIYGHNSHTSVVGMRGVVLDRGGEFQCQNLQSLFPSDASCYKNGTLNGAADCECFHQNLLVLSAECNFGGDRLNVKPIVHRYREISGWSTLIDLSKAASTNSFDLKENDPDFACISFYKLFGEPTGLGALFVRRSAIGKLNLDHSHHRYFGGGSVDVVLPNLSFQAPRRKPSLLASLKNGTPHYRGIVSLIPGFSELESLGGMSAVSRHSTSIAAECVRRLGELRHHNGRPAVILYGGWAKKDGRNSGPTVAFNCVRSDGSFVGYNEFLKLAELYHPSLQLRGGCFCNPGACQEALGLTDNDVRNIYLIHGHVCGDHKDVINGTPTGAIRASFGKDSLWEDMDSLLCFLTETFVQADKIANDDTEKPRSDSVQATISEMYIYPIKSCAAQKVESWIVENESGRFVLDREFALVDSSGTAMRLQRYPKMTQIQPQVDLDSMIMRVSAPGCTDLIVSLGEKGSEIKAGGVVEVCGNKCGGQLWGDYAMSQWFSDFLGVQCWLARHNNDGELIKSQDSNTAFVNEEPILLITQNAVDKLNIYLEKQGQQRVLTKHFRPNVVISVDNADAPSEVQWKKVQHTQSHLSFRSMGECARCSMVDVDPLTGLKGKTLHALAAHRRQRGRITFGIFLCRSSDARDHKDVLSEGDVLLCKCSDA